MHKEVKIARHDLYQRVWSEPVTKLSNEFGLSDVGFAKLCKRNDIPRPPRGFWARKAAGQKVKKAALPEPEKNPLIIIKPHDPVIGDKTVRAEAEKELAGAVAEEPITVSDNLRGAHPLVSQSLHALEKAPANANGLVPTPDTGCLDIMVSKGMVHRALCIMDALIKAMETRGYQVLLSGEKRQETVVHLMNTDLPFCIRENLEAKKVEDDPEILNLEGQYRFRHSRFREKTVPSGNLVLAIDSWRSRYFGRDGCRRRWSDGKRCPLEANLNQFIGGLVHVAAIQREAELERERQDREREAEEQRAAKREATRASMWAKIEKERRRVTELAQDATAWEESQKMRAYIEAVRENASSQRKDLRPGSETEAWLRWAMNQADRLDPLKKSPPSILDDEAKYRPPEHPRYW